MVSKLGFHHTAFGWFSPLQSLSLFVYRLDVLCKEIPIPSNVVFAFFFFALSASYLYRNITASPNRNLQKLPPSSSTRIALLLEHGRLVRIQNIHNVAQLLDGGQGRVVGLVPLGLVEDDQAAGALV